MLPSIPIKCIFTKIRGCLSARSISDCTSIMSLSCFLLPSQMMLFSTRLRPSRRQCSLLKRSISVASNSGKHKLRLVLTTRFRSLGIWLASVPSAWPIDTSNLYGNETKNLSSATPEWLEKFLNKAQLIRRRSVTKTCCSEFSFLPLSWWTSPDHLLSLFLGGKPSHAPLSPAP